MDLLVKKAHYVLRPKITYRKKKYQENNLLSSNRYSLVKKNNNYEKE